MTWNPEEFTGRLQSAVDAHDRQAAYWLCRDLIEHLSRTEEPYPKTHATDVLDVLRRKRHFDLLQRVSDALIQTGQDAPKVKRQYAQSQIEKGNLTAAIGTLEQLTIETAAAPREELDEELGREFQTENAEARGLIGRAYKQMYVDAGFPHTPRNRRSLEQAISSYLQVFQTDQEKHYWHGINTVALLRRAERDGIDIEGTLDLRAEADNIARSILDRTIANWDPKNPDTWACATAVEACVALDLHDDALVWLTRYLQGAGADAFELGSTFRQLVEVWKLTQLEPPGDRILPVLSARLLKCKGGEVEVSPQQLNHESLRRLSANKQYQQSVGVGYFEDFQWFVDGVNRGRSVASVQDRIRRRRGTAFLIRGGDLNKAWGDEMLVMTNAHVISENETDRRLSGALLPSEAFLHFDPGQEGEGLKLKEVVWSSRRDELDATLIRLDGPAPDAEPFPVAAELPDPKATEPERVYVIGHPRGRDTLSYSMNDNELIGYYGPLIHYSTITKKRNSGSPVFNSRWELIGLHHYGQREIRLEGGGDPIRANEGITIEAIRGAVCRYS